MVKQVMVLNFPSLWYDVTDTLKTGRRTGIQRVVVELARELQRKARVILVRFDPMTGWFITLTPDEESRFWGPSTQSVPQLSRSLSQFSFWRRWKGFIVPSLVQPIARLVQFRKRKRRVIQAQGVFVSAEILGDPLRAAGICRFRAHGKLRSIHVLYDFLPLSNPGWTTLNTEDFDRHWNSVRSNTLLVAISNHTREEALALSGRTPVPIVTAYPGVPVVGTCQQPEAWTSTAPFFLCVGTLEDRKNQRGLLQGFRAYRDQGGGANLVFVGGPGRGAETFSADLHHAQGEGYPVAWLDQATDGEVNWLYEHAVASVYVSFAEGFGLPVLESLGRGTPCITSDRTSTGELARAFGGCLAVDPQQTSEITAALLRFDAEPGLRAALTASIRHPLPTWEGFASAILDHAVPLRLLFDVSILGYSELRAQYRTGIYQVAVALLKALSSLPGVEVGVYSSSGNLLLCRRALKKAGLGSLPVVGGFWSSHVSFAALVLRNGLYKAGQKTLASWMTRVLALGHRLRNIADRKTLSQWDAYLSPMDEVPEWVRDQSGLVSATLIHDLIPLLVPDYAQDPEDPTRWFSRLMKSVRPSDQYFTVSEFTRQDFLRHFPALSSGHVTVAPNAVDRTRFAPGRGTPTERPYFLAVSTIEPRKRLDAVMAGFTVYRQSGGRAELVVCGSNRQGHQDLILRGLDPSVLPHVRFTGYVEDDDLPGLYGQCLAFVSLSEYEGFGLPILEAMTCGAPVIVSPNTSHPEVAGDAGVYVDPNDYPAIGQAMLKMEQDPAWRVNRSVLSLKGAERFSWHRTAQLMADRLKKEKESH